MKDLDCYRIEDHGWDGFVVYGPYTEHEALKRWPNDIIVRVISKLKPKQLYSWEEDNRE